MRNMRPVLVSSLLLTLWLLQPIAAAPPAFVDITWMSITNMYYELGPQNIVTDGYMSAVLPGQNMRDRGVPDADP